MAEPIKKKPVSHAKAAGTTQDPSSGTAESLKEKLKKRMKIRVTKK
jgi:hypothetical protein